MKEEGVDGVDVRSYLVIAEHQSARQALLLAVIVQLPSLTSALAAGFWHHMILVHQPE